MPAYRCLMFEVTLGVFRLYAIHRRSSDVGWDRNGAARPASFGELAGEDLPDDQAVRDI